MRDVPLRLKWKRRHMDIIWPWELYDPDTKWCTKMVENDIPEKDLKIIQFEAIDSKRPDWENWW